MKLGLDIDGVLGEFSNHFLKRFKLDLSPAKDWDDNRFRDSRRWEVLMKDKDFWLTMPVLETCDHLESVLDCYITARPIPSSWSKEWLHLNGFPKKPVYTVGLGKSKVQAAKRAELDIFVDDSFKNFEELNNSGIFTFLRTRSHNEKFMILKSQRLNSLKERKLWEKIQG